MAPPRALPHTPEKPNGPILDVGAVVAAHDGLDRFRCLVGVVEGDRGDVVVQDMGFDDAVEELASDETEFAVDGCGRAAGVGPAGGFVMRERGVGVLKVSDGDCNLVSLALFSPNDEETHPASGSPIDTAGCTIQPD